MFECRQRTEVIHGCSVKFKTNVRINHNPDKWRRSNSCPASLISVLHFQVKLSHSVQHHWHRVCTYLLSFPDRWDDRQQANLLSALHLKSLRSQGSGLANRTIQKGACHQMGFEHFKNSIQRPENPQISQPSWCVQGNKKKRENNAVTHPCDARTLQTPCRW